MASRVAHRMNARSAANTAQGSNQRQRGGPSSLDPIVSGNIGMVAPVCHLLDVQFYLDVAETHGRVSVPDHEVGDLQGILRAMWKFMSAEQRVAFAKSPDIYPILDGALAEYEGDLAALMTMSTAGLSVRGGGGTMDFGEGKSSELRRRLREALCALERAGGRGVDVADEIDGIRFELKSRAARKGWKTRKRRLLEAAN
jgi:hypothetical protein